MISGNELGIYVEHNTAPMMVNLWGYILDYERSMD